MNFLIVCGYLGGILAISMAVWKGGTPGDRENFIKIAKFLGVLILAVPVFFLLCFVSTLAFDQLASLGVPGLLVLIFLAICFKS